MKYITFILIIICFKTKAQIGYFSGDAKRNTYCIYVINGRYIREIDISDSTYITAPGFNPLSEKVYWRIVDIKTTDSTIIVTEKRQKPSIDWPEYTETFKPEFRKSIYTIKNDNLYLLKRINSLYIPEKIEKGYYLFDDGSIQF